jgi:uncharacterized membrane protein
MDDWVGDGAVAFSLSKIFIAVSVVGIALALYHAWLEHAFTTNIFAVHYAPYAALYGVPYWILGVVWFPLILVVGVWSTKWGSAGLKKELVILLTVGNVLTGYFWYLDLEVVKAFTLVYVALYVTNYALTALVVVQHRSADVMQGYVYGTVTGAIVGLLFGPYGVVACGIGGGIFGAARNYVMPRGGPPRQSRVPV